MLVHISVSGEVVQSGIGADDIVELGQVEQMMQGDAQSNVELQRWLRDGLLVYKSIGVSMTDLAASKAILEIAARQGLGVSIQDF